MPAPVYTTRWCECQVFSRIARSSADALVRAPVVAVFAKMFESAWFAIQQNQKSNWFILHNGKRIRRFLRCKIINDRDQDSTKTDCKQKLLEKGWVVGGRSEIVTMKVPEGYPVVMEHPEQELILGGAHLLESAYELWEQAGLTPIADKVDDHNVLLKMNPNLRATLLTLCFHQKVNPMTPSDVLKDIKETYNTMNKGADESVIDRYLEITHIGKAYKMHCEDSKDDAADAEADGNSDGDGQTKKRDQSGKSAAFKKFLKEHFPMWSSFRFSNARRFYNWMMDNGQWGQYKDFMNKNYNFEDEKKGAQESIMETNFKVWECLKKSKLEEYTHLCCRLAVPNKLNKWIIRCPKDAEKLLRLSTPLGSSSGLVKQNC